MGSYTITVPIRAPSLYPLTVAITGPAKNLAFAADAQTATPFPTNTGVGAYTVKATDENGNLPTNVGDDVDNDFEALVSVRPTTSTVLGTNEGKITFDAKTGETTFYVQVSDDAEPGDSLTISVTAIGDSSIVAGHRDRHLRRPSDRTRNADERHGHGDQLRHDYRVLGVPRRRRRQRHHGLHGAKRIHGWLTT